MSKKASVLEEKYCNYELQILGIIEGLKKFRLDSGLLGNKFIISIDCSDFTKALNK